MLAPTVRNVTYLQPSRSQLHRRRPAQRREGSETYCVNHWLERARAKAGVTGSVPSAHTSKQQLYLGEVSGAGAAAVADHVAAHAVCGVGALQDGGQLRVPHAGLLSVRQVAEGQLAAARIWQKSQRGPHLVVHTEPGPMPILMMSAPDSSSSSAISPVTTLPAAMVD
jgi:hypothetical protein